MNVTIEQSDSEDSVPLTRIKQCNFDRIALLQHMEGNDFKRFSKLLDELPTRQDKTPLPKTHEINQHFGSSTSREAGKTLLYLSVELDLHSKFCRLLIKKGASANLCNLDNKTAPILLAIEKESYCHVDALLENSLNKADVDDLQGGQTAVDMSIKQATEDGKSMEILELVLSNSNKIRNENANGHTLLYATSKFSSGPNLHAVRMILKFGEYENDIKIIQNGGTQGRLPRCDFDLLNDAHNSPQNSSQLIEKFNENNFSQFLR